MKVYNNQNWPDPLHDGRKKLTFEKVIETLILYTRPKKEELLKSNIWTKVFQQQLKESKRAATPLEY